MSKWLRASVLIVVALSFSGCAIFMEPPAPAFTPHVFDAGQYGPKVDNFIVLQDLSSSMGDRFDGRKKISHATLFLNHMNQTLPEVGFTSGIRSFGAASDLVNGMTAYTTQGFAAGINAIGNPAGNTPIQAGIATGAGDLRGLSGKIAVLLVSDGVETRGDAVEAAQKMKNEYGERLCIYTIQVGDNAQGKQLLEQIADAGGCGFSVMASEVNNPEAMADFVAKVFLERLALDSDGDGVYDDKDQCPDTPKGVQVDEVGCPIDSDRDGVADYLDECPGTPYGAKVNDKGCWILGSVLFDTDKAVIKTAAYSILDEVVTVLNNNPEVSVVLEGHTDSVGGAKYNEGLAQRRADAVKTYLIEKGIAAGRLSAKGFGLTRPIDSNDTPEGRTNNRRTEIMPIN